MVTEAFKTLVVQVAEVPADKSGKLKVERAVCVVDCGIPANPNVIVAQMEGGISFGLGAILYSVIALKDGKVEQNNFGGYQMLRVTETPRVEVHVMLSDEAPIRIGESGMAPTSPTSTNATFTATGQRLYNLPFPTSFART